MTDRIDDGDGGDLLPEFEEIVAARNVLSQIITGIENGVFGMITSETDPQFLTLVPEHVDDDDDDDAHDHDGLCTYCNSLHIGDHDV